MSSPHNATGYYTVYGEEALHADHFTARLSFGDTQTIWARTGYLGFLRRTELTDASGGERKQIHLEKNVLKLTGVAELAKSKLSCKIILAAIRELNIKGIFTLYTFIDYNDTG